MGSRWSNSFVGALYDVAAKVPDADNAKLFELIKKAGGGKAPGDLERLVTILASGKNPTMTIDEAVKAIDAADAFVAAVAKAMADPTTGYDAMIKLVWGEGAKVEGELSRFPTQLPPVVRPPTRRFSSRRRSHAG